MDSLLFFGLYTLSFIGGSIWQIRKDIKNFSLENVLQIWNTCKRTIFINICIISPIFFYSMHHIIQIKTSINYITIVEFIFQLIVNLYLYDVQYYWIHKLFHTDFFQNIHWKSHKLIKQTGFSIFYCSPIDFIGLHLLPIYSGLIIMNSHIITYIYFSSVEIVLLIQKVNRDFFQFHHKMGKCNYGIDIFMDGYYKTRRSRKMA